MRTAITAMGVTCALALAGCADKASSEDSGHLTLGLLTSLSGAASSHFKDTRLGIDARLAAYRAENGKCTDTTFDVVQADDASSPQGSLAGTQKLLQQDKVDILLENSPYFFGAAAYATGAGKGTPVVGGGTDGAAQWEQIDNNLFPVVPVPDPGRTYATTGTYLKSVGGTRVAAISYDAPSAKKSLEASVRSAEHAGIARAYVNTSVPIGSTDVGPLVLGIMKSRADVVLMAMNPDTALAVVAGLTQAGYRTKATVSPTGYGPELLASAAAVQAAQNVTFSTGWQPAELHTAATKRLAKYLGTGTPSMNPTVGWFLTDRYLRALDKAGCDASADRIIATLRADKAWNGGGLYPFAFDSTTPTLRQSCQYFLRLKGKAFVPEPHATPICGPLLP